MLTMAVISSETEMDKPAEYVSMKFLLKQVYAAHTTKVKELESEVKELKKQLEDVKRNSTTTKSNCDRCKEMELAYSVCKEYKNVVLEQTKKLKEFEQLFSSVDKNKRQPEESPGKKKSAVNPKTIMNTVSESVNEIFLSEWDETTDKCENAPIINFPENDRIETLSQTLMPPPPVRPVTDDVVLVPDTCTTSKSFLDSPNKTEKTSPKRNLQKLSPKKIKQVNVPHKDKENKLNSPTGTKNIKNSNISKKRTLNELNLNEVQAKKQHSTKYVEPTLPSKKQDAETSISLLEHPVVPVKIISNDHDKKLKKTVIESNGGGRWAENFKDFSEDHSTKSNFSSAATSATTAKVTEVIDDDFQVKNSDENGTWKTSIKKNAKKPPLPKTIKCTSRYKITLDAPNFDVKKPNLKQMKLSRSVFMPPKAAAKNEIIIINDTDDKSNDKSEANLEDNTQNTSSSATLSQLASLVDYNSCSTQNNFEMPLLDVVSETVPQDSPVSCQSETFCPLLHIAENKPVNQAVEKDSLENLDCKSPSNVANECFLDDEADDDKEEEVENEDIQIPCDSFDRLPIEEEPNYKYKEDPVRNKNKRKQLDAFNCKDCEKYYTELGLSDEEKKKRLKECSRHRAKYVPPPTPEHFWELEFPDTEECKVRGYVAETQKVLLKSRRRRPLIDE